MVKDSEGHGCNEAAQMLASQRPEGGACTGGQRRPPLRENNREILPMEREVQLKGGAETSSHTGDQQGEAAREAAGAGTGENGQQTTQENKKGAREAGLLFREPVRMQVLMPGHDPVEVMAYATVDARLQAASLLNVDIAEAMRAKVAVETAALRRWQEEHARDAQQ